MSTGTRTARFVAVALLASLAARARGDQPPDTAAPTDTDLPALLAPFPFDHDAHADAFRAARLVCVDCHPVGLRRPGDAGPLPLDSVLPPPRGSCHACHRSELPHAPRAAPSACGSCHADLDELKPVDHDLGWIDSHGLESRSFARECADCHQASQCFDCHDDRGASGRNPHPPAFRTTHGVEARLDPRSCTTCHAGETCTTCHSTGTAGGGWPW